MLLIWWSMLERSEVEGLWKIERDEKKWWSVRMGSCLYMEGKLVRRK